MDATLVEIARRTAGFLPDDEGLALYRSARSAASYGPLLEIGAWCGKSAVYLGAAAAEAGTVLFSVDHHRGSQECQPGWDHHDPAVVDPVTGRIDTLPFFRRTMESAGLEDTVVAVVGESTTVAGHWSTPLGLVFIDGGHNREIAGADYRCWWPKLVPGGQLAIHDVFADPADGGQAPYEVYLQALNSGSFDELADAGVGSLRILRRLGA